MNQSDLTAFCLRAKILVWVHLLGTYSSEERPKMPATFLHESPEKFDAERLMIISRAKEHTDHLIIILLC